MKRGTLILFCGKMGAGKSTHAARVAAERNAVVISEDTWLSTLFPDQIHTFGDYLRYSARLRPLIGAHVVDLLTTGTHVAMDFPANTAQQRLWFRELVDEAECRHELIYLRASDALCLQRIARRRREQPERAAFDTEAVFKQVTRYFEEPDASEGFEVRVVDQDA